MHTIVRWIFPKLRFTPLFISLIIVVEHGESIASEGKGDYLFVEGRVTDTNGKPIPNATIDTWEVDGNGQYDTQVCLTYVHPRSHF